MTKEEVEKWYDNLYESGRQNDKLPCTNCLSPYTVELIAHNDVAKYSKIGQILKQGWFNYEPHYHKVYGSSTGMPEVDFVFVGADITIREAFCSKECFINYIYSHQTDLIELITQ